MGNLYLAGVLKNILPQNVKFLDKLAKVIQKEYYRSTIIKPEKALKESLKEANESLEQIAKKGDVSWLGNLSFTALSLKNYQLNFTKIGDLKIFLLRGGKIVDIDKKLKLEEILPWPLKVFGNIVSGKISPDDVILVSTKEVTDFLQKENLLSEIAKLKPFSEKRLKEIFDKKKENVLKISGLCLALILTEEVAAEDQVAETPFRFPYQTVPQGPTKQIITPKTYPKEFHLREALAPLINIFKQTIKSLYTRLKQLIKKIRLRPPAEYQEERRKLPRLTVPKLAIPKFSVRILMKSKKLILILALIFFLCLGFFISQFKEGKTLEESQDILQGIQEKVNQAESLLALKAPQTEKEAELLFKESWEEISQLSKAISKLPKDFQDQVSSLKEEISGVLFEMNEMEMVEEPELFFDFDHRDFVPYGMVISQDEFYFFSPHSQNLFRMKANSEGQIIEVARTFNFATPLEEATLFFSKPDQLTILNTEGRLFSATLEKPYDNFSFDSFAVFRRNLYFLDKNSGKIIKYPYLGDFKWGSPEIWLSEEEKKTIEAKSLTIDGSIWVLNKNNSLGQYYQGTLKEEINLEIFPEPKDFKKIFASPSLPYLYLLEPDQKRIIILNKDGEIIKQFQSQKFNNLLDFLVPEDGEIIYLLNDLKVYKINI